jgi:hypothetical protein
VVTTSRAAVAAEPRAWPLEEARGARLPESGFLVTGLARRHRGPRSGAPANCMSHAGVGSHAVIPPSTATGRKALRVLLLPCQGAHEVSKRDNLIQDRDPLFAHAFTEILRVAGVKTVKLRGRSPDLNTFGERYVLSVRTECLRRVLPPGEKHLRTILSESSIHYHSERNHQGLGDELLTPLPANTNAGGLIRCRERLGGILRYYFRDAA